MPFEKRLRPDGGAAADPVDIELDRRKAPPDQPFSRDGDAAWR